MEEIQILKNYNENQNINSDINLIEFLNNSKISKNIQISNN
jgi:hypothetical protein